MRTSFGMSLLLLLCGPTFAADRSSQNRLVDIATIPIGQRMEWACDEVRQLKDTLQREKASKEALGQLAIVEVNVCTSYHQPSNSN